MIAVRLRPDCCVGKSSQPNDNPGSNTIVRIRGGSLGPASGIVCETVRVEISPGTVL